MTGCEVIKMLADCAAAAGAGNGNGKVSLTKMYKEAAGHPPRIERAGRVHAAAAAREQRTSPPVASGACQMPVLLCDRPCSHVHPCSARSCCTGNKGLQCQHRSISLCWLCASSALNMAL